MRKLISRRHAVVLPVLAAFVLAAVSVLSPVTAVGGDADGAGIFKKKCASCHGADGTGDAAKAKKLKVEAGLMNLTRDEAKKLTADDRKKILSEGKNKMPKYAKKLSDAETAAVLAYVEELVKKGGKK